MEQTREAFKIFVVLTQAIFMCFYLGLLLNATRRVDILEHVQKMLIIALCGMVLIYIL